MKQIESIQVDLKIFVVMLDEMEDVMIGVIWYTEYYGFILIDTRIRGNYFWFYRIAGL